MPGPIKTEKPKNVKKTLKKLLSSIKKLYLGKDLEQYNLEEDSIENVKLYVEKVADDNGVSVDKVLSDVNFLSDLKGV